MLIHAFDRTIESLARGAVVYIHFALIAERLNSLWVAIDDDPGIEDGSC